MKKRLHRKLSPVAFAAAALLAASMPARPQYYDYSGSVYSSPTDVFPVDVFNPALDLRPNTLYVADGSFAAFAGADLQASALYLGTGSSGNGTFSIEGQPEAIPAIGALVRLTGTNSRLEVGYWGTGTLTASKGAVVDAALDATGCAASFGCGSSVGSGAGSTGTLTVTGAGSEVRTARYFNVGISAVYTVAGSGSEFGSPGGTATGSVYVLDGGLLRTETGTVAYNLAGPNGLGTEKANGTVMVDGAGSQWIITRNSVDNTAAILSIGLGSGATGLVTVSGGGKLQIDGTGSSGPNDGISVGSTGQGALVVTGSGSSVQVGGVNTFINVGASGTSGAGSGSFEMLAGATVSGALYLNVGRNGGTGTMLIDGAGSKLTQSGVGTNQSANTNGPASASIGRNNGGGGGTGSVTVSNGGSWRLDDGGGDGRIAGYGPTLSLGRGAQSQGTLSITGPGSTVELVASSLNPGAGVGDNFNPTVNVGYDNAATSSGTLIVSNGGKLVLTGNAKSTVDNPRNGSLNIGGRSGAAGTGTATVTGASSQILLTGDSNISVGRTAGSNGTFSVLAGASASSAFVTVGREGGTGSLLIDGVGSSLSQSGLGVYSSGSIGPSVGLVGWGGTGHATVSNGALWSITDGADTSAMSPRGPALYVGVDSGAAGGTGTLAITGAGSKVELSSTSINPAPGAPDSVNPVVYVGSGPGSSGSVTVATGGKLSLIGNAISTPTFRRQTNLFIGGDSDTAAGGTGALTISGPGSQVRLEGFDTFVTVGRNGNGTLTLENQALLYLANGGINVGRATSGVGVLNVDNSTIDINGQFASDTTSGAFLSIGNRGGNGTANIGNGSVVTLTNTGSSGAGLSIGGTTPNPLGTGVLNLSGGSTISIVAAPGQATMNVGRDGSGIATLSGAGTQIDVGDGALYVGRLPTGVGTLSISGGAKLLTGNANIGGSSDTDAGGIGSVALSGLGSELRASGASGFIGVGRGGTGTLTLTDQAMVSAIGMGVGRGTGGNGTLIANNATLTLAGQQTTGATPSGGFFNIGQGGGTGAVTLSGTNVALTNAGSAGAALNLGGSGAFPLGSGTLTMLNSSVTVSAQPGLGAVNIGRTGTGTATLINSSITNQGGNVYIGREAGSVGVLSLNSGSTLTADFVGVGVNAKYDGTQHVGGTGIVALNNSTIRAAGFELGAGSVLTGNGGTIEIVPSSGDVVIGGTIAPGNSPGRLRIRCNIIMLGGSRIILEVSGSDSGGGLGDYDWDELIIDSSANFNLASAQIEFSFLGDTNPNQFAAIGGMNLDNFLRAETGTTIAGLSTVFAPGQTWSNVVNTSTITAVSEDPAYSSIQISYSSDGNLSVVAVPEPSTWVLMFVGLAAVGAVARRRHAQREAEAVAA